MDPCDYKGHTHKRCCWASFGISELLVVLDLDETLLHASLCKDESMSWLPPRFWQPKIDFEATGKGLVVDLGEEVHARDI